MEVKDYLTASISHLPKVREFLIPKVEVLVSFLIWSKTLVPAFPEGWQRLDCQHPLDKCPPFALLAGPPTSTRFGLCIRISPALPTSQFPVSFSSMAGSQAMLWGRQRKPRRNRDSGVPRPLRPESWAAALCRHWPVWYRVPVLGRNSRL